MKLRSVIFWTHLAVGLCVGAIVLLMSITGILMAFEHQLIDVAESGYRSTIASSAKDTPLAPSALVAKAREGFPEGSVAGITMSSAQDAPATVSFGREITLFLNPYTGVVLGRGTWLRPFLHDVEQLHRNLLLGDRGKIITGTASLGFLGLLLSGLYLWIPRRWTKLAVKAASLPRWNLKGRSRDWNWHNAFGLWASIPLLLVIVTGLIMSFQWANNLLFIATGSPVPPPRNAASTSGQPQRERPQQSGNRGDSRAPNLAGLDSLWAQIATQSPGWQTISFRLPAPRTPGNSFLVDTSNGARPDKRVLHTVDLRAGKITKTETFSDNNKGRQLRMWVKPLHTGEAGGLFGQIVAALAAGSAAVLVWTGFALSYRRFFVRKGERAANAAEPDPAVLRLNS
ncbi:MAG TPA: PepSY-associated TM helix domain-containing protein [Chthoniobacterales bacterium]